MELYPKLRTQKFRHVKVDRVVNKTSSSSTVELVYDTYRTIDESYAAIYSRSTVTL